MKTFKILFPAILLMVLVVSCKKDLVDKVYGTVDDASLWKTPADLTQALNSGTNSFDATWAYGTMFYMVMEDAATDYWVGGANTAGEFSNFSQWRTGYPDPFDWGLWPEVWSSIYTDNLVLDRMKLVPLTPAQKNMFKGQAEFWRAFNYYNLQNEFGGVALVTSPADTRTSIPPSTRDQIRTQIESDLLDAANLLVNKNDPSIGSNYSQPSKQAAQALLARLYLNWTTRSDHWQKTSDMCDQLINNAGAAGIGLVTPYSAIFDLGNKNNSEMVFSIKHSSTWTQGVFLLNDYFTRPGNMAIPNASQVDWGDWTVTSAFYQSFEPGDARQQQLLMTYNNTSGTTTTLAAGSNPIVVKYPLDPTTGGAYDSNDMPIIRFADILLMKAEAANELGDIQTAITNVNLIRTRAGLGNVSAADVSSQATMRTHIYNERRWEFFDEGLGRADMIRNGTFLPWVQQKTGSSDSKYLLYPFSTGALQNNTGLKQNPGYLN